MKSVIYYPYFEVQDTTWLKFASLYIGRLTTMIPTNAMRHISDESRSLLEDKSFIRNYNSLRSFSEKVPLIAMTEVDKFLKNPYFKYYGIPKERLVSKDYQTYEIFDEKFSLAWREYCLEKGLGHRSKNGIKVTNEIALIYMHALAKQVAVSKNSSPITDSKYGQEFLSLVAPHNIGAQVRSATHEEFAKRVINFKLPVAIEDIEIKEFMDLRKDKDFIKNQKAFHASLDSYLENNDEEYMYRYLDSLSEMERDIKRWIPLAYSLGVAATEIIVEPENPLNLLSIGESMMEFGTVAINPNEENRLKRSSNKFLTNISNIQLNN
ncbi:hypothetical protein HNQ44_002557 [Planomicrobium koreense]|uniref:Uncharacterized protein n=1 Tax=Planococcus koreensis TaxID=112331 RepID=A0A7W8CSZ5_9BACL|nr:hypothetical protein [Planococcus koreensis]MBB5181092.1 hypothetical protein [Planococcus koreensis]